MSYLSVIRQQGKEVNAFVRIAVKRFVEPTLNVDVWECPWPYKSTITQVAAARTWSDANIGSAARVDITPQMWRDNAADVSTFGGIYVDEVNEVAYFKLTFVDDIGTISTPTMFLFEYREHFSTMEMAWPEIPDIEFSTLRKWKSGVVEIPNVRKTCVDNYAGMFQSDVSPIVIYHNGLDLWETIASQSVFQCEVDAWVCVGPLRTDNCRQIFSGIIDSVVINDRKVTLELVENLGILDNSPNVRTLSFKDFPMLDPSAEGRIMPKLFGVPRWIRASNVDWRQDGATTSFNRAWVICDISDADGGDYFFDGEDDQFPTVDWNHIVMSDIEAKELNIGDFIHPVTDPTRWYRILNIVPFGPGFVRLEADPVTTATGPGVKSWRRPALQQVRIQVPSKRGSVYDKSIAEISLQSTGVNNSFYGFSLTTSFESNSSTELGLTTINPSDIEVWCRMVGGRRAQTYGSIYLNDDLDLPHEVTGLYWYLRHVVGLPESKIDGQSFIDCIAVRPLVPVPWYEPNLNLTNVACFAHPIFGAEEDHKTVIGRMLMQIGAIGYFDPSGRFKIVPRGLMGDPKFILTDSELIEEPLFEIRHSDVSQVRMDAASQTIGVNLRVLYTPPSTYNTLAGFANGPIAPEMSTRAGKVRGDLKVKDVQIYDIAKPDTQMAGLRRLAIYHSDRRLYARVKAGGPLLDAQPGDIVLLKRALIPGLPSGPGVINEKKFFVVEAARLGTSVELLLDDQYSIEQNGSF